MPPVATRPEVLLEEIESKGRREFAALGPTADHTFDGYWIATFASPDGELEKTRVCISGTNVWHDGECFAKLRQLTSNSAVLIAPDEDVKGFLRQETQTIEWEDGDVWDFVEPLHRPAAKKQEHQEQQAEQQERQQQQHQQQQKEGKQEEEKEEKEEKQQQDEKQEESYGKETKTSEASGQPSEERNIKNVQESVFRRDLPMFSTLIAKFDRLPEIPTSDLCHYLKWNIPAEGPSAVPLIVVCILLSFPEGVELCVEKGADVNLVYSGPHRLPNQTLVTDCTSKVPLLRLALSVRGPAQCEIVQHLLAGRVRCKTVQLLRKKYREEMEYVTAQLLDRFEGPFAEGP